MNLKYFQIEALFIALIATPQVHAKETPADCDARNDLSGVCKPYVFDASSHTCVKKQCPLQRVANEELERPGTHGASNKRLVVDRLNPAGSRQEVPGTDAVSVKIRDSRGK